MSELTNYAEAVTLAKQILHGPCDETMGAAGRIIRFLAAQEAEDVPKLPAEIERLKSVLDYINELAEEFFTVKSEGNVFSIPNTNPHKDTLQEIFVISHEAVNADD